MSRELYRAYWIATPFTIFFLLLGIFALTHHVDTAGVVQRLGNHSGHSAPQQIDSRVPVRKGAA